MTSKWPIFLPSGEKWVWNVGASTGLFMILWHLTKSVHLNGGKYFSMPHPRIETPQVHLYTLPPPFPRLPHSAFAPVLHLAHDYSRPGAASLTIKIAWPNAMRFFLPGTSAACTAWCACAGKTNRRYHLRNRSWHAAAGMGENGLSAWRLSCHKGRSRRALTRYAKKTWSVPLSISRSRVNSLRQSTVPIS